jgi:hypothetical protein
VVKRVEELSLPGFLMEVSAVLVLALLGTEKNPAAKGDDLVPDHSEWSQTLVASHTGPRSRSLHRIQRINVLSPTR